MDRRKFLLAATAVPLVGLAPAAAAPVVPPPKVLPDWLGRGLPSILYSTVRRPDHVEHMVAVFNPAGLPPLTLRPWYSGITRQFQGFDIDSGGYRTSFDLVNGYMHQQFATPEGHAVRLGTTDYVDPNFVGHYLPQLRLPDAEVYAYNLPPVPGQPADAPVVVMLRPRYNHRPTA